MQAATIDDVLTRLEEIIDHSISANNRAGYFAALYHKVTRSVKEGIQKGQFDDGARMEKLDVLFANRYLLAYEQWKNSLPVTGSWQIAFETTKRSSPLLLQHLLLGMNAHINLDLGIAAVETAAKDDLKNISNDFNSINIIIASLTYELLRDINRVSPLLSLIGLHATNYNSLIIQFSIANARDGAWRFAEELYNKKDSDYDNCIKERDNNIAALGQSLVHANPILRFTLWIVHLFEWKKPSRIINVLTAYKKEYLTAAQLSVTAS